jgi:peptidoglycan hydrolase-like protein with peptidoglycan-binding domain
MSNSTDNFGDTDPFFDENAEPHQWKLEPSEDDLEGLAEDSGTSGESTDHPNPESLLNPYGNEEVSFDSQGTTDDSAENHYESDSHNGDHSSGSSFGEEATQDERADHDAQPVDNDPNHLPEEVTQTWEESRLPDPVKTETEEDALIVLDLAGVFGDKPAASTQSANAHSPEQTRSADPSTVAHSPTTQHNDHPNHPDAHKQPEPTPTLDDVAQGSTTLRTGHEGESIKEIQRLLDLQADGIFSAELAAQIAQFQESQGIDPSGEVDQLTLEKLQQAADQKQSGTHQKTARSEQPHLTLKLGIKEDRGFQRTPSTNKELDKQPTEKSKGEEPDNLLQQAARIINEGELGFLDGYSTSMLPPLDQAATQAFRDQHNNIPYVVGKTIADGIVQAQAIVEGIAGVMAVIGGSGEAGIGVLSDEGVLAASGVATAAAGIGLIEHSNEVFQRATEHLVEDLQRPFNPIDDGGGGSSKKSDRLSAGAQEAKDRGWPDPPEGHEWYKRKRSEDEVIEGEEGIEAGEGGEEGTKDVLDLRRKPGFAEKGFPERQYNPNTQEFVLREKTPDLKAKKIGEDIEIDVSTSKLFDEQLKIRGEAMEKRDELLALREEFKKQKKVLSEEDELKLKDAIQKVQDSSEAMGEIGINHFMETQYPHYERIEVPNSSGGAKQDRFDSIYKDPGPPPEYIVLEGKGGDGKFTTRKVGEDGELIAQQCTPEYNDSIIRDMKRRREPEAKELRKALKEGRIRTFKAQTPIKNSSAQGQAPNLSVPKLKVSEYDMTRSIRVDKTPKSANPQAPSP